MSIVNATGRCQGRWVILVIFACNATAMQKCLGLTVATAQLCACGGTTSRGGCTQMVGNAADTVSGIGCVCIPRVCVYSTRTVLQLFWGNRRAATASPKFLDAHAMVAATISAHILVWRCRQRGRGCIVCWVCAGVSVRLLFEMGSL